MNKIMNAAIQEDMKCENPGNSKENNFSKGGIEIIPSSTIIATVDIIKAA